MPALHELTRESLPGLTPDNYRVTSPATWDYNCIAWVAGVTDAWWWPVAGRYWPPDIPREESLAAFLAAFAILGYTPCATADREPGLEKIALYAVGATPTHAARQLPSGLWSSKLGPSVDIEHACLEAIAGGVYGQVVAILSRKTSS
jgi:hypothetical protein